MRIIFLLSMLLFSLGALNGQFGIKGSVRDVDDHKLIYASVYLQGTEYAVTTDENGNFEMLIDEEGIYILVVKHLGYREFREEVVVDGMIDFNIILEGLVFGLDEIEIKGTWAKDDYPFAKSDFNEETLVERNHAVDAPYLLQFSPSVVVSSDAGAGVGYTGIRIRGIDPTRVNVTVNGIPLNDAESHSVYWVDLPDIMNSVRDVQIQRGVGTSTNGSGAFGASINLNTNKVHLNNYANIEGALGSYNTNKISAELGTGLLNDKFTIDGRYTLINSDGYIDRAKSSLTSYYVSAARISEKQSLRLNHYSGHEITYQAWYGLPVQFLDVDRTFNAAGYDGAFTEVEPYDNEVDNYKQSHTQLFWNKEVNPELHFDLGLHYTRGNGFYEQFKLGEDLIDYGFSSGGESDLVRRKWLDNHFFGAVFNIKREFENSDLLVGGGLHDYIGRHFGQVDTILMEGAPKLENYLYYDNSANKLDLNTYVKYQHRIGSLNIFGDLQYRFIRYSFLGKDDDGTALDQTVLHHFLNPKAGLFYSINENNNLYASVAVAHREPNRDDYVESSTNSRPDPERLIDYELGYRLVGKNFNLGAGLYYMDYKDHLVLTGKINDVGDYTKVNIPDSYRAGIELDINVKAHEVFEIGGALTLSRNKIRSFEEFIDDWDTGLQLAVEHEETDISFSPNVIAHAEASWDITKTFSNTNVHDLDLNISSKYVGKQYLDNTMNEGASLDPFNYTDLKLSYSYSKGIFKNAVLELNVANLFDQKYVSNGWVYRYSTQGWDPTESDPYSVKDREDYYQMIGLFPQALRNYMLRLRLEF